jgi:prepilin-type N-terminal cleavage/methylation domain-containing protein
MDKRQLLYQNKQGFSLVEIVVALALVSLMIVSLANLIVTIGVLQRQNRNSTLATRAAENKIEELRNNHYNTLPLSPPPLDFTSELPPELASPRSATVTISEPNSGMRRLEIDISYREGLQTRNIKLSALLGNIGLAQ